MDLITDPTASATDPGVPSLTGGVRGYFVGANPGVSAATRLRYWFMNMIMKELVNLVTTAGLTPDPTNSTQVLQALMLLFQGQNELVGTSSGSFVVPNNVKYVETELVGGGGAGGSNTSPNYGGGGGGAGGYARTILNVTPGQTITYTIGAGGAGGSGAGGAGGNTSVVGTGFDVVATGGQGGSGGGAGNSAGGGPGVGISAAVTVYGGYGGDGQTLPNNASFGGNGGASFFGGGGRGGAGGPPAAGAFGAGGGGAYGATVGNGGNGAPGIVIFRY